MTADGWPEPDRERVNPSLAGCEAIPTRDCSEAGCAGASKGPNFAGHYTAVTWGWGTECQTLAIVDARTGRVYFAPSPLRLGAEYRRDSSLIANPPRSWREVYG